MSATRDDNKLASYDPAETKMEVLNYVDNLEHEEEVEAEENAGKEDGKIHENSAKPSKRKGKKKKGKNKETRKTSSNEPAGTNNEIARTPKRAAKEQQHVQHDQKDTNTHSKEETFKKKRKVGNKKTKEKTSNSDEVIKQRIKSELHRQPAAEATAQTSSRAAVDLKNDIMSQQGLESEKKRNQKAMKKLLEQPSKSYSKMVEGILEEASIISNPNDINTTTDVTSTKNKSNNNRVPQTVKRRIRHQDGIGPQALNGSLGPSQVNSIDMTGAFAASRSVSGLTTLSAGTTSWAASESPELTRDTRLCRSRQPWEQLHSCVRRNLTRLGAIRVN